MESNGIKNEFIQKTLSLEITINQTFYGKMEAWPKWKKNVQPFIKLLKNHGLYQHIDFDTFVSSLYHPKNLTRSLLDFVISEKKSSQNGHGHLNEINRLIDKEKFNYKDLPLFHT